MGFVGDVVGGVFGKGDEGPPPPDYRGAAEEQARSSREVTAAQTYANRPQQTTPWGTSVWTPYGRYDPGTGQTVTAWEQNISLTPEQQAALDAQMRIQSGRTGLAEGLIGRAGQEFGAPVGWEALDPNTVENSEVLRRRAEEAVYNRLSSRLDPQWEQSREATESQLWNQGLRPGDEAYDAAMGNFERARTDAYQAAMNEAVREGRAETESQFEMGLTRRQQALSESLQRRGWSLNEINALLTGQQVGMPQMPGFERAARSEPTQYLPAATAQYGSALDRYAINQQAQSDLMGGMFSMAGQLAPYAFAMSDRRLKSNIRRIGTTLGGTPLYSYTIFGRREIGVMADEAPVDAVVRHPSGFLMVDYSRIR